MMRKKLTATSFSPIIQVVFVMIKKFRNGKEQTSEKEKQCATSPLEKGVPLLNDGSDRTSNRKKKTVSSQALQMALRLWLPALLTLPVLAALPVLQSLLSRNNIKKDGKQANCNWSVFFRDLGDLNYPWSCKLYQRVWNM
ncbi:hypothetical protein J4Q44_G00149430 [Coregonus suidteri]|uniref:Uncharacterized protein n=1 Tax=Coregonus suidteri TaxID=861788 RepID=A0AAN8LSM7_9TELE